MDDTGCARITDFGFSIVTHKLDAMWAIPPSRDRAARWTAPEVLIKGTSSKEMDVFSLAMVTIEVSYE